MDFNGIFERSPNPYMVLDRGHRYVAMNAAYERAVGRDRAALLGMCLYDAFPGDGSELGNNNVRLLRDSIQKVFDSGERDVLSLIRYAIVRDGPDGPTLEDRYWSATHTPLLDADGRVAHVLQHTTDVTELQRLNEALRVATGASYEQIEFGMFERAQAVQEYNRALTHRISDLETLFAQAPGFMAYLSGPTHRFEQTNRAYQELVGRNRELVGLSLAEALPEAADQGFLALLDQVYRSGEPYVGRGVRLLLQREAGGEAEEVVVDFVYQPVRDAEGRVVGIFVQGNDMTSEAAAQAALARFHANLSELVEQRTRELRESEEERRLAEAALHQAQKLEAIGKLTGGVAHDFNNLLQVVGGNLDLLECEALPESAKERLDAARGAVQRGARVVSQLLAFARSDAQNLTVFDPAEVLERLGELLQRTLGEGREVSLELALDASGKRVRANLQQFENAILNLAINARDALPEGGRVRIGASAIEGDRVRVSVADDGVGIAPDVVGRIFDPFFTTKPAGQGTGLGLAAVYGFVKQSGGDVKVSSRLGEGTEIVLELPACADAMTPLVVPQGAVPRGDHETVLLVEDDDGVRDAGTALLAALGYEVVPAANAAAAWSIIEAGLRPALLLSDIVMPGPLHCFELVERVRKTLPDTAVLLASGYAEDVVARGRRARPDVPMMAKPYTHGELARQVRAAIEGHRFPHAPSVILVDDDPDDRFLNRELLEASGLEVAEARDAEDAMRLVETGDWDMLLTDVELPGCDGIELARRAGAARPGMRVIFVTGHGQGTVRDRGGEGVVLTKPFSRGQLMNAIALARLEGGGDPEA